MIIALIVKNTDEPTLNDGRKNFKVFKKLYSDGLQQIELLDNEVSPMKSTEASHPPRRITDLIEQKLLKPLIVHSR